MKKEIAIETSELEWLYSQDWEYFDYGICKRHLQVILPYSHLGLKRIEGNEELAHKASCIPYINSDIELPPILMFHSENDPVVSVENSRTLYEKLEAEHQEVDYYEMKNCAEHGGNLYFTEQILSIIQNFINEKS